MFEGSVMTFKESLVISGLGLAIVFSALVTLALSIVAFSKIFGKFSKSEQAEVKELKPVREEKNDIFAVLMAAVSEEVRSFKGKYVVKDIKEIK